MLISDNIVRLSTRSYRQRLEAVASNQYHIAQLARLNRDLDNFHDMLYSQCQTVTKDEYRIFGKQLDIMLQTLKELYNMGKQLRDEKGLDKELEKLGMNYSAIYEINSDIKNFKIKAAGDMEMGVLLRSASDALKSLA